MVYISDGAFTHDGKLLATTSFDKTIKIWDLASHRRKATLDAHTNTVQCCEFSPSGDLLVSGSLDKSVRVWDVKYELVTMTFRHTLMVSDVHISDDEEVVVSCGNDSCCKLWHIPTKKNLCTFDHYDSVLSCSMSKSKAIVATCSSDNTTKIWDTTTCNAVLTLVYPARGCELNPSASQLLLAHGNFASIFDTRCGDVTRFAGHSSMVFCCARVPNSALVVSCDRNGSMIVWDTRTTTKVTTLHAHDHQIISRCQASACGQKFVTCSPFHQTAIVWSINPQLTNPLAVSGVLKNHERWT